MGKKTKKQEPAPVVDKHMLYEAAVQNVEIDYDFFQRVFRRHRKRPARLLREDFCGTALLSCEWVRRDRANKAWAVDLDPSVLDWSRAMRVPGLGRSAARLELIEGDACAVRKPAPDIICALNFSYSIFKQRRQLGAYFRAAHDSLKRDGIFIIDAWGGPDATAVTKDKRTVAAGVDWNGNRIPKFSYRWEQSYFNFVDNHIICHIHFRLPDGTRMKRAFTYDWRLWGTPELRDLLHEVGFRSVDIYLEGWDHDTDDTDGVFRRRTEYLDMLSWVGYLVAVK